MDMNRMRKAQGRRLQAVRKAAGFRSAREAAIECHWPESTYRAHENGSRTIGQDDAFKYMVRFEAAGAKGYTPQWLMFGDSRQSLDDLLKDQPPDIAQRAYEAALAELEKRH